jgi:hypothetical protein
MSMRQNQTKTPAIQMLQEEEAEAEARRMIGVYEDAATQLAAIPVIAGADSSFQAVHQPTRVTLQQHMVSESLVSAAADAGMA